MLAMEQLGLINLEEIDQKLSVLLYERNMQARADERKEVIKEVIGLVEEVKRNSGNLSDFQKALNDKLHN